MNHTSEFEHEVVEQADVGIVLADGCRLSARIWMPANANAHPVPAILEYLPYRKRDGTIVRDELSHPWLAGHGYACIRVDMRGNGDSQGLMLDEYTVQELNDACEIIAWLRTQAWCSGNVGMMGISWGGFNSLQVAALQPAGLKAIITLCSTVDRFADDIHYKGGCLLNENIGWAATMLSYSSRPPDPILVGDSWREQWLERLENMPFLASTWLRHQHRDAYWKHGSVCEDYSAIKAAVLSVGGWHDGYRNTISHLVENIDAPVKGIVGPWIHKYPHYAGPKPAIGFLQEALRWWDKWLKDIDTGIDREPAYRAWLMDSVQPARWLEERPGQWIAEDSWPASHAKRQLLLVDDGLRDFGQIDTPIEICSPQNCGENSGEYFPFTFGPELPDEQSADDSNSTCFDTAEIVTSLDIVGAPSLDVSVSADAPQGMLIVRLCDLRVDGTSALITMGLLNLQHRESSEQPQAIVPGEQLSCRITLDQIAYRVPAGHRLRIAISTSYWPFVWPSPENVTVSLHKGVLSLPERVKQNPSTVQFADPIGAPAWLSETLRETSFTRETSKDTETGVLRTEIVNDFGEYKDNHHGLTNGSTSSEIWSIHPDDPLSAQADLQWRQTGGRDDWQWSTDAVLSMRCDEEHFYLYGKLRANLNNEIVFDRDYTDTIKRVFI